MGDQQANLGLEEKLLIIGEHISDSLIPNNSSLEFFISCLLKLDLGLIESLRDNRYFRVMSSETYPDD